MRVASWNVNGLRSIVKKGFVPWAESSGADVIALQETRVREDQLQGELAGLESWSKRFVAVERFGYSGVGVIARREPDETWSALGVRTMDSEGRVLVARFGRLHVASVYFPNGSGLLRDNARVPFKLRFYRKLHRVLEPLKARGEPILVVGDFNTAPHEIDLARPRDNAKTSGFLPEERKELLHWMKTGWVDTFREHEKGAEHYTWWSQRFGVRERNVGWRIDLALASPGAARFLTGAAIHRHVMSSDHCPISVDLDDAVMGG